MGIYGVARYGLDKYGEAPKLSFSVAPFRSSATGYNSVELSWTQPAGDYKSLRLVRSQDGYPETEEDGIILWEWFESSSAPRITTFVDEPSAVTSPLVSGRFVYYTIWALKDTGIWTATGSTLTVVPKSHAALAPDGTTLISTQDKLMDYLPRVYTSRTQSPLDVVDSDSELYRFLSGLSFTLDELLTLADNLLPDESGRFLGPQLVELSATELGFTYDPYLSTKNKKRLVREGIDIFAYKGTFDSTALYAESLTGFAPEVTASPNLMLGLDNSTFYKGTGFWYPTGNCTLNLETTVPVITSTTEPNSIDKQYCARIDIGTAGAGVRNGDYNPITRGIPVQFSKEYAFSYYVKTASGSMAVTPSISWFDFQGTLISKVTAPSPITATTNWTKQTLTATAPGTDQAYSVTEYSVTDDVVTLTTEVDHLFLSGDQINVDGVDEDVDGLFTITSKTNNTITYSLSPNVPPLTVSTTPVTDATVGPEKNPTVYASVELEFGATGTIYLDAVQVAESSVTGYDEARGIEIFLRPAKTNYLNNPSFDSVNPTEWAVDASSFSYVPTTLEEVQGGDNMLNLFANPDDETSISASTGTITTGKYYTFSIYAQMAGLGITAASISSGVATLTLNASPAWEEGDTIQIRNLNLAINGLQTITAITGNQVSFETDLPNQTLTITGGPTACRPETMSLKIDAYDEVESEITDTRTSDPIMFTDVWTRYSITLFVSSNANDTHLNVSVVGNTQGCSINFDAAQVEEAYLATDYFDGGYPLSYGAVWEDVAHESPSHLYPNKDSKLIRLKENLHEFLPLNTAFRIRTFAGVEYAVLP